MYFVYLRRRPFRGQELGLFFAPWLSNLRKSWALARLTYRGFGSLAEIEISALIDKSAHIPEVPMTMLSDARLETPHMSPHVAPLNLTNQIS